MKKEMYTGLLLIFNKHEFILILPELSIGNNNLFSIVFTKGVKKLTKKKLLNLIKSRRIGRIYEEASLSEIKSNWLTNANKLPFFKIDIPKSMIEVLPLFKFYEEFPIKFNINSEDEI